MAEYVDLSERVSATFYSDEYEEWTQQTVTIADVLDSVCDNFRVLPSAQPDVSDINVGDIISRQAAIDAIKKRADKARNMVGSDHPFWEGLIVTLDIVEQLPSAQPERKKGKWISTDDGWNSEYFVCSVCGCPWTLIKGSPEDNGMNFCPNCGAYMRGEQND